MCKYKAFLSIGGCASLVAVGSLLFLSASPAFSDDDDNPGPPKKIQPFELKRMGDKDAQNALQGSNAQSTGGGSRTNATSGTTSLPVWTYSVTATQNNRKYSGIIVGANPASPRAVNVPVVLVPVVIKIAQAGTTYTFDPTAPDAGCLGTNTALSLTQASPLFNSSLFTFNGQTIGSTQYPDAFLKGEFWNGGASNVTTPLLSLTPSAGAELTITLSAGRNAAVYSISGAQCNALIAVVNINSVDSVLQSYIRNHGLTATQFPFFLTYNAVMSQGSATNLNNCCILGYHSSNFFGQTYGIAEFEGRNQTVFSGVSDVAAASHEINEWANDPLGNNPTPAWGAIGQVSGCQSDFEVGDPLSSNLLPAVQMPNGFSYHLQELAYFSWFYGGNVSLGYSNNGTFKGAAKICPPGGTN